MRKILKGSHYVALGMVFIAGFVDLVMGHIDHAMMCLLPKLPRCTPVSHDAQGRLEGMEIQLPLVNGEERGNTALKSATSFIVL